MDSNVTETLAGVANTAYNFTGVDRVANTASNLTVMDEVANLSSNSSGLNEVANTTNNFTDHKFIIGKCFRVTQQLFNCNIEDSCSQKETHGLKL